MALNGLLPRSALSFPIHERITPDDEMWPGNNRQPSAMEDARRYFRLDLIEKTEMPRVPGGRSTIATVWKFRSAFLCSWVLRSWRYEHATEKDKL